ncbi:hypothetical protein [Streptomyces sp. SAI-127]|uniref:hypothetical protein n=1 Tax=Streptomyces sp. SAI-127 TaxID=2940543 RepID=UPI0024738D62|nr:hypothetical protein [Streptomyces sp. SAI-127]MDH6493162.1 hypothetical protein [Streptomyces sp. SAI-127]
MFGDDVREVLEVKADGGAGIPSADGLRPPPGTGRTQDAGGARLGYLSEIALDRFDRLGTADLTARVDELVGDNQQVNRDLAQARERVRALEAQLAETQDDLAAARGSLRKMIKEGRQSPQ